MITTRTRCGAILEWLLAAACVAAILAAGSFTAREFGRVRAVMPVIAREAPAPLIAPPAGVPAGAVSLPILLLSDGKEVRIGETVSVVSARLGKDLEVGVATIERAPNGERVTRTYRHAGMTFQLVFEPFEKGTEPRLAAIYR